MCCKMSKKESKEILEEILEVSRKLGVMFDLLAKLGLPDDIDEAIVFLENFIKWAKETRESIETTKQLLEG